MTRGKTHVEVGGGELGSEDGLGARGSGRDGTLKLDAESRESLLMPPRGLTTETTDGETGRGKGLDGGTKRGIWTEGFSGEASPKMRVETIGFDASQTCRACRRRMRPQLPRLVRATITSQLDVLAAATIAATMRFRGTR